MPVRLTAMFRRRRAPARDAGLARRRPVPRDEEHHELPWQPGARTPADPRHDAALRRRDRRAHRGDGRRAPDERRTAAASAVATQALARPESSRLALLGAGVQAAGHLEAMARCCRSSTSRSTARTPRLGGALRGRAGGRVTRRLDAPRGRHGGDALGGADVVCTVSSAREPVVTPGLLEPGTHVNAVGSHAPTHPRDRRRGDARRPRRRRLARGDPQRVRRLPAPDRGRGSSAPSTSPTSSARCWPAPSPGGGSADEITIYQSCGIAVQDVARARSSSTIAPAPEGSGSTSSSEVDDG